MSLYFILKPKQTTGLFKLGAAPSSNFRVFK